MHHNEETSAEVAGKAGWLLRDNDGERFLLAAIGFVTVFHYLTLTLFFGKLIEGLEKYRTFVKSVAGSAITQHHRHGWK